MTKGLIDYPNMVVTIDDEAAIRIAHVGTNRNYDLSAPGNLWDYNIDTGTVYGVGATFPTLNSVQHMQKPIASKIQIKTVPPLWNVVPALTGAPELQEGYAQEQEWNRIRSASNKLRNSDYVGAEVILGRNLSPNEIQARVLNRSVPSDQERYLRGAPGYYNTFNSRLPKPTQKDESTQSGTKTDGLRTLQATVPSELRENQPEPEDGGPGSLFANSEDQLASNGYDGTQMPAPNANIQIARAEEANRQAPPPFAAPLRGSTSNVSDLGNNDRVSNPTAARNIADELAGVQYPLEESAGGGGEYQGDQNMAQYGNTSKFAGEVPNPHEMPQPRLQASQQRTPTAYINDFLTPRRRVTPTYPGDDGFAPPTSQYRTNPLLPAGQRNRANTQNTGLSNTHSPQGTPYTTRKANLIQGGEVYLQTPRVTASGGPSNVFGPRGNAARQMTPGTPGAPGNVVDIAISGVNTGQNRPAPPNIYDTPGRGGPLTSIYDSPPAPIPGEPNFKAKDRAYKMYMDRRAVNKGIAPASRHAAQSRSSSSRDQAVEVTNVKRKLTNKEIEDRVASEAIRRAELDREVDEKKQMIGKKQKKKKGKGFSFGKSSVPLGRFYIHGGRLAQRELHVVDSETGNDSDPLKITPHLKDILTTLLQGKKPVGIHKLPPKETLLLYKMLRDSGSAKHMRQLPPAQHASLAMKIKIDIGELDAGNNNPAIKKSLYDNIMLAQEMGLMTQEQFAHIFHKYHL